MCGIVWKATAAVVCSKCTSCVYLYLLVLSDSFLLLLDPLEFYSVRAVSPGDNVALWAVGTANLTARARWFVNESARRTRPTLRTKISCFHFLLTSFLIIIIIFVVVVKHLRSGLLVITWTGAVLGLSASFSWGISRLIRALISVEIPLSEPPEKWPGTNKAFSQSKYIYFFTHNNARWPKSLITLENENSLRPVKGQQ